MNMTLFVWCYKTRSSHIEVKTQFLKCFQDNRKNKCKLKKSIEELVILSTLIYPSKIDIFRLVKRDTN